MASSSSNHPPIMKLKNGEDIISSLPDSVLIRILSFVPTEYAVRTSILSSRWKLLWSFVPNLVFGFDSVSRGSHNNASLMNFVDRVFLFHNLSCIRQFYLYCSGKIDESRLNVWIGIAMKRNVSELNLDVYSTRLQLPQSFFTCKSLVKLRLFNPVRLDVPELIHFPCLKVLDLSLRSSSNELTQRLFNSCPVLEELRLYVFLHSGGTTFNISVPSLRIVHIVSESRVSKFLIDAPVLEELHLLGIYLRHCVLNIPSSVVFANISLADLEVKALKRIQHRDKVFTLLKPISNVRMLCLSNRTMEVLSVVDEKDWPVFPNLLRLEVLIPSDTGFKVLPILLNNVLRLKRLDIVDCRKSKQLNQLNWYEPRGSPSYVQTSLQQIKFVNEGFQIDLDPIKYFLWNAIVLRKLTLVCKITTKVKEDEFYAKIINFPRCSEACEVVFDNSHNKKSKFDEEGEGDGLQKILRTFKQVTALGIFSMGIWKLISFILNSY